VSCAIIIISFIPLSARIFASSTISSCGLLTNGPLIYGIAQYVHLLLHPSPIFKYAKFVPVVTILSKNSLRVGIGSGFISVIFLQVFVVLISTESSFINFSIFSHILSYSSILINKSTSGRAFINSS